MWLIYITYFRLFNKYSILCFRIHQTHYEQFGDTRGTVHIEGMDDVKVDIRGVRDHSYGKLTFHKNNYRFMQNFSEYDR